MSAVAEQVVEKKQYNVRIWIKDFQYQWHFLGDKRIYAENLTGACSAAKEEYNLHRYIDFRISARESDQYRPKIRGWR